jgi:hypothetical protein
MTFTTRRLIAVAVAVTALALPGTAAAKGGTSTPPPSTVPAVQCDWSLDGPTADGGSVFSNQAGDAGCISVVQRDLTLRLYRVELTPGWTYTVTSDGGGTNSRVEVKFENPATGQRVDARIEFGKTWIR